MSAVGKAIHQGLIDSVVVEVARIRAEGGGNPRVHPNGFIQLDLEPVPDSWHASHQKGHSGASRRLHIWNPPGIELPHQKTVNEVHDHVFDMDSAVLIGELGQLLYRFIIGQEWRKKFARYQLYRAVYEKNSDSRLQATGLFGHLEMYRTFNVTEGCSYRQPAFTFHDSNPHGLVVTVMTKMAVHEGEAHVLVPDDIEPDNSFDRASAAPAELLWQAIEASLA